MQTSSSIKREYDYIVVGSGAGGGPVAANLALAGYRVLLLEAGGDHRENIKTQVPAFHGKSTEDVDIRWDYWVQHYTSPQRQKRDPKYHPAPAEAGDPYYKADSTRRGILYPRCSALGGCTVHNAMICTYPHNSDWDRIADFTGDDSWRADQMRTYYERLERCQYGFRNLVQAAVQDLLALICIPFNPGRRGFAGWLSTSRANPALIANDKRLVKIVKEAFAQTAEEGVGNVYGRLKSELDPNAWRTIQNRTEGLALTPLNVDSRTGRRSSPRERILETQRRHPDRLIIQTNALVRRVLFEEVAVPTGNRAGQGRTQQTNRAIGVEYVVGANLYRAHLRAGETSDKELDKLAEQNVQRAYVTREVILAAGAFNTPQILIHSGIGPKEELRKAGYDPEQPLLSGGKAPIAVLPGVGENLQDRYEVGVVLRVSGDFAIAAGTTYEPRDDDPHFVRWRDSGSGIYSSNGSVIAIVKRSLRGRPDPDLYIFGIPGDFRGYEPNYATRAVERSDRFTWVILKAHTRGRAGYVRLRSPRPGRKQSDFWETPEINFRQFDDDPNHPGWQEDVESIVEGLKYVRRMNDDDGLKQVIQEELVPGQSEFQTDEQLAQFAKDVAWGHHASCTCRMGPDSDPLAVLDSNFRVRGVRNLRVVDASVFPDIPGLFIVSAIYMAAEKASDVILTDAERPEVIQGELAARLDEETIAPDEDISIQRIISLQQQKLVADYQGKTSLRDTHPKSNGLLRAKFVIEPTLKDCYRHGIFRQPREFDALLRYSNSAPEVEPDYAPDFRGIGIKLLGVKPQEFGPKFLDDEQNTQDFLMIAHNRFFAANPRDFADFFDTIVNGKLARWFGKKWRRADIVFRYVLKKWRIQQAQALLSGRGVFGSPLEITWFSISPYRLGPDLVVKYKIQPSTAERSPIPRKPSQDYLRQRMVQQLSPTAAGIAPAASEFYDLDFLVQQRTHPEVMPIENTSVPWDETRSPFVKLATIRIPRQIFDTPQRQEFDESLSFNPWHCIADHQPLGGINRARRHVMKAISDFRLARNNVERVEPTIRTLEEADAREAAAGGTVDGILPRRAGS